MFVALSPTTECASETLCSLNFASRVAKVELGQAKRNVVVEKQVVSSPLNMRCVLCYAAVAA